MNPSEHRYRAFISYSQRDREHAKRLHTALESYRVPKGVSVPLVPNRRLGRFFRDDDETGASNDLGATLREALDQSENLIVICSPHAARSKWVNAEIEHFKATGHAERIFAVIADGLPNSGDPETECFPPALRPEPLGIDLRRERFARTRIRLVAGLLGINFDDLWQRERRRAARRRLVAGLVSAALAAVIGFFGWQWYRERGRVRAQRVDRTLVRVRDNLASGRVREALGELGGLYDEGERGAVEGLLKTTLSWVTAPAEQLKEVRPPAFITNGPGFSFVAVDGGRVNVYEPYRRILSSDKRRLLLIASDEAVVLDIADGRELARTNSNRFRWTGIAFETPDGLLVVAGNRAGLSQGTLAEALLVYSAQRQTLSVFDEHLNAQGSESYRFVHPLAVGDGCRRFGVIREGFRFDEGAEPQPSDLFFISADAGGLKASAAPGSLEGWRQAMMFEGDAVLDQERAGYGSGVKELPGCVVPSSDSTGAEPQPPATGPPRAVGFGVFWESAQRWKAGAEKQATGDADAPCTEARPCAIQDGDPRLGKTSDGSDFGVYGWKQVARPRGVRGDDRSFDAVDKEPVVEAHDQNNAGIISAWCRRLNSKAVCLAVATTVEVDEERTVFDLRSNTGRFIFYPREEKDGFRLYDLSAMRDVTPRVPELLVPISQADFAPDDARLYLTVNGHLLVFTPPAGGSGPWGQLNEGVAVQIPALAGDAEDAVAGLLAIDDNDMVVIRRSGLASRFNWRTGAQSWGHAVAGVGEVYRVAVSRNRRFLVVIGRAGVRLLDAADGLVLSGVLVPPPAMDGSAVVKKCFEEVFVTNDGTVEATCGGKLYRREQVAFGGDAGARLREILADRFEAGS